MKYCVLYLSPLILLCDRAVAAELPPLLKPTAEEYDKAVKGFEDSAAAKTKAARDAYLAVLNAARKREVGAKRADGVTGIDAEIAAVNGGNTGGPDDKLPADLRVYRDRFIADTRRAQTSNDSVRKAATDRYLKWLSRMEENVRGKDAALLTAILAEKKRVGEPPQGDGAGKK